MTQTLQDQLADLQDAADLDSWADARCAEYEEEADARRCLGEYNGPQADAVRGVMVGRVRDEWTPEDEARYQAEEERIYLANANL